MTEQVKITGRALGYMQNIAGYLKIIQEQDKKWSWGSGAMTDKAMFLEVVRVSQKLLSFVRESEPTVVIGVRAGIPRLISKPDYVRVKFEGLEDILETGGFPEYINRNSHGDE